jgi:hypothetical protein
MAASNPFAAPGIWLRCALHAHTTRSDGELPPDKLVRHYERAGFDVLAITDHDLRTEARSTDSLLVLRGSEIYADVDGRATGAHVLGLGIRRDPERRRGPRAGLAETVSWILAQGGVPFLSHPYWSGLRPERFEDCEGLVGFEIYNAACELQVGRGLSSLHWDEALEAGHLLFGIATDDSHQPGYDSALAWVWARCAKPSREAVLDALRTGCFYSSAGPVIHELELSGDTVELRCSPAASVTLLAGKERGARVNSGRLGYRYRGEILEENDAGDIVASRLRVPPRARYGRIEIADARGRKAWTNPLWH